MRRESLVPILIMAATVLSCSFTGAQPLGPSELEVLAYGDGWVRVSYEVFVPDGGLVEYLPAYGSSPDFTVVLDEEGLPLNHTMVDDVIEVEALGAKRLEVSYFTAGLIDKEAEVWTLNLSLGVETLKVLLPEGARVVGLSNVPDRIASEDGQTVLYFFNASGWVSYVLPLPIAVIGGERGPSLIESIKSHLAGLLFLVGVLSATMAALFYRRRRRFEPPPERDLDEIDLLILTHLAGAANGCYLSDLGPVAGRSKPTVWRRTKKLERAGLVEIVPRRDGSFVRVKRSGLRLIKDRTGGDLPDHR